MTMISRFLFGPFRPGIEAQRPLLYRIAYAWCHDAALADDLGWNDLTLNGVGVAGGSVPTPSIDSLATEGVNFTGGYAANATCAPSRAAILSGRYGTRFGFEFTPTPPGMST